MKTFLYQKLTKSLLFELIGGGYGAGDRFLSKRKVMRHWKVSEPTAKTGLAFLVEHNLILAKPRSGYVVRQHFRPNALILLHLLDTNKLPTPQNWRNKIEHLLAEPRIKSHRLGVIFDTPSLRSVQIPDVMDIKHQSVALQCMQAFFREAQAKDCTVEWFFRDGSAEADETILREILRLGLSGVAFFRQILFGPIDAILEQLIAHKLTPITLFDEVAHPEVASVKFNNFGIGYDAASRLMALGHANLAVISTQPGRATFDERVEGFNFAIQHHNNQNRGKARSRLCVADPPSIAPQLVEKLLQDPAKRPSGLFFTGHHLAKETVAILQQLGLEVPQDISIIACGRSSTRDATRPKADIYSFDVRAAGKLGFQVLHRRLSGEDTEHVNLVDIDYCPAGAIGPPGA